MTLWTLIVWMHKHCLRYKHRRALKTGAGVCGAALSCRTPVPRWQHTWADDPPWGRWLPTWGCSRPRLWMPRWLEPRRAACWWRSTRGEGPSLRAAAYAGGAPACVILGFMTHAGVDAHLHATGVRHRCWGLYALVQAVCKIVLQHKHRHATRRSNTGVVWRPHMLEVA